MNSQFLKNNIHIIGIAGGSCSGKTFLCKKILNKYKKIVSIKVDSYYKDFNDLSFKEREKINFDHPSSFEFNLLLQQLNNIKNSKITEIPTYNYKTHTRSSKFQLINNNSNVILVEGILALYDKKIRDLMSMKVYIDIPNNIRKSRRIERDKKNRARTESSILNQYKNMVEPMYIKYIKPTIRYADLIINKIDKTDEGYNKLISKINKIELDEK